jgi:molybdopterin synthase catalytic subunit
VFEITTEELNPEPLAGWVRQDDDGAVVVFVGVVRNNSKGKKVSHLIYDAYGDMARRQLQEVGREIRERWEVGRIAISHRIGRLLVGEKSVVIAVSAPHRKEAFNACAYAIDRIKEIVPIWKQEVGEDGAVWV